MPEEDLNSRAIQAALEADWESAITYNKESLKENPEELEALNRLGRAYSEIGQLEKAKASYREVLKHDPYNSIALKNLERLKAAHGKSKLTGSTTLSPDIFLESPGKTKVLDLGNLAKPGILAALHTGDRVEIGASDGEIYFEDASGVKLGVYQGSLAAKLSEMVRSGNVYEACVKSVKPTELRIFVREVQRAPKFAGSPSFPIEATTFRPYVHEVAVNSDPIVQDGDEASTETESKPKKAPAAESLAENETVAEEPEEA